MKKTAICSIGLMFSILSLNVNASTGFELRPFQKHKPFTLNNLKSKGSSDEGIKGKILISAGVGLNLAKANMLVKYNLSSFWVDNNSSWEITSQRATPMINVMCDYGLGKKFSVGAAFGYQTIAVKWGDGYNMEFTDSWKRIHLAVRGDFHIVAKENVSLYTGLKFGYNIYTMTSTATAVDPTYTTELGVHPSPISVQAHFGFSYYFNDMIGFNTELGLGYGGPYIFAVGLAVKL